MHSLCKWIFAWNLSLLQSSFPGLFYGVSPLASSVLVMLTSTGSPCTLNGSRMGRGYQNRVVQSVMSSWLGPKLKENLTCLDSQNWIHLYHSGRALGNGIYAREHEDYNLKVLLGTSIYLQVSANCCVRVAWGRGKTKTWEEVSSPISRIVCFLSRGSDR